jgi:pimeloyl-ACP methyl ester carboxylesterase
MDAAGLPAAILVGHSMGATVAQRFAVDYPDRVAGLVLVGSFATLYKDPGLTEYYTSAIAALRDPVPYEFAKEFQVSTLARDLPPAMLDTFVKESLKLPARVWQALFKEFVETPDFGAQLAQVTAPTLIVWGSRDAYATQDQQDRLRTLVPRARFIAYTGVGHAVHWEEPARFVDDLIEFVYARQGSAIP